MGSVGGSAATPLGGRRIGLVLATSTGGTGRHVRAVADAAVAAGAEVVVAGPSSTEHAFGFSDSGATFRPVEIAAGPHPIRDVVAWRHGRSVLADREIVHAHGLRAGLIGGLAAPRRTPVVVTWHNAVLKTGLRARVLGLAERHIARRAEVTLCVSADLARRVKSLGGQDVRVAPVGSSRLARSDRSADEVRQLVGATSGESVVLAIGRLHPQKGLDLLIRAAARIREDGASPTRFLVAGDGPARAELAALNVELGSPVHLLGWRSDTGDLLAAADLVVMPSRWEGSPLSAHETLLAGRPLVAAKVGGLPELLGDGAACLIPPDDVPALVGAITTLLADRRSRDELAQRGQIRGSQWPDATTAAEAVIQLYVDLLGTSQ